MNDEPHLPGFTFLNEGALMQKSLFMTVSICLALALGTASPIQAQTTFTVNGTAGFDTGLQRLANLVLDHVSFPTDLFPLGAVIHWGDGTHTDPGLLDCSGVGFDPCNVYGTHRYASASTYSITIEYNDPQSFPLLGAPPRKSVNTTAVISSPSDFVILSIGDSIASGEGDPVIPQFSGETYPDPQSSLLNWAFWDDPYSDYRVSPFPADEAAEWPNQTFPCHLSGFAGPALAGLEVQGNKPGVTFVHYACSGAKINSADTAKNTVQDAAGQLIVPRKRLSRIDVLIISAGANDFNDGSDCVTKRQFGCGFGALFQYCLNPHNTCSNNPGLNVDIANSLNALPSEYQNLVMEINCVQPFFDTQIPGCTDPQKQIPKLVLITEYMHPTHDQNGHFSTSNGCPVAALKGITFDDWKYLYGAILHPLNLAVDAFPADALKAGLAVPTYAVTGIEGDFLFHGLCAGDPPQRWVLTPADSTAALGAGPHIDTDIKNAFSGAGHPNSFGQADYRDRIYAALVKYNPPITTPSATTGGRPYVFGTWTTHDVIMTLSATNGIKEAGVGATFYGLDEPQCTSANTAGCKTYSGPFEINTSGKHTVTFFSQNAQGYPDAVQSVQVWVDNEPPVMTCTATPSVLWPPNNKMVPVNLHVTAVSAAFGPTPFSLKSVATSEGNAATDIHGFVIGQPSTEGSLLASRLGNEKTGRVYTFVYQSADELGLTGTCTAQVQVPHDQGRSHT